MIYHWIETDLVSTRELILVGLETGTYCATDKHSTNGILIRLNKWVV